MKKIVEALAAAGGAVASFFMGLPPVAFILLAVMALDYISGLICGFKGVSPKTQNGGLSSRAAFDGLLRKALILLVVLLAHLVDTAVILSAGIEFQATTGATILWFIASEGISILENAAALEIRIPKILMQALELFKAQGGDTHTPSAQTVTTSAPANSTPMESTSGAPAAIPAPEDSTPATPADAITMSAPAESVSAPADSAPTDSTTAHPNEPPDAPESPEN